MSYYKNDNRVTFGVDGQSHPPYPTQDHQQKAPRRTSQIPTYHLGVSPNPTHRPPPDTLDTSQVINLRRTSSVNQQTLANLGSINRDLNKDQYVNFQHHHMDTGRSVGGYNGNVGVSVEGEQSFGGSGDGENGLGEYDPSFGGYQRSGGGMEYSGNGPSFGVQGKSGISGNQNIGISVDPTPTNQNVNAGGGGYGKSNPGYGNARGSNGGQLGYSADVEIPKYAGGGNQNFPGGQRGTGGGSYRYEGSGGGYPNLQSNSNKTKSYIPGLDYKANLNFKPEVSHGVRKPVQYGVGSHASPNENAGGRISGSYNPDLDYLVDVNSKSDVERN